MNLEKLNLIVFEMMSERFGVKYEQICYIGDSIQKDFIAQKRLGMRCICF